MNAPRIGALFAGYGGLDLAATDVFGGSMAWYSEIDKGALKVLTHRFPDVPNVGDVTAVDWSTVEPVDILTGGSPCQDLSHAGKRAGMTEGTRSNLWVAMREAIAQLRPRLIIWENVRGAASAEAASEMEPCPGCVGDGGGNPVLRALGRVVGDLAELGYVGRFHGLFAGHENPREHHVGAPHKRFRYFLIASDAERGGWDGWAPDTLGRPLDGTPAAGSGEDARLLPTPSTSDTGALTLLPTPAVNDMGAAYTPDEWDEWTDRMKAAHGNGNGHGKSLNVEAQRLLPTPMSGDAKSARNSTATRHKMPPTGIHAGDTLCDITYADKWGDYAPAIARWEALTRPAPPPTETGPKGNPRLSPRFSEWLMGLPDGWVTDVPGITRNEALKALGNGVVPQQAAAALRTMLAWEVAA